ncbi:MAG: HAD-IIIC family phosphatase [Bacteroidales bacterium]|jgi:FkbH-like protein|nr:HAD-IIIC family phosphatase [Bacteroidales bacterium]
MITSKNSNFTVIKKTINVSSIEIYMNHFVKKFRNYNYDEFLITISSLMRFIHNDDKVLTYLFEQLKENNFTIEFDGNEESINHIDIICKNVTKDSSYNFNYQIQNLPSIAALSSKTDIPVVGIIIMNIVAQIISKLKILYKAIVLDLDDTLWKGTLSEVGIDGIIRNMYTEQGIPFIEFMKFVKTLADEFGVFIAICSRNDSKIVESTIEELDDNVFPLKNHIDCIIANNNDKSENIKKITEQLPILPDSIVFIDDNKIVRDEVKHKLPEVLVPEWKNHNELVTQLITGCIFERVELSLNSQNRRKQYKIIQTERCQNLLPTLNVKVINDDKHTESIKLYSKSNQFKFSQNDDKFDDDAKSLYFEIYRENGESLGICSAITYTLSDDTFLIHNWAISCRFFEIGLEEFILMYIQQIANSNSIIFINYQHSEYNQKVNELLAKYSDAFKNEDKNDTIRIVFTKEIADNINKNTNLKTI